MERKINTTKNQMFVYFLLEQANVSPNIYDAYVHLHYFSSHSLDKVLSLDKFDLFWIKKIKKKNFSALHLFNVKLKILT